MLIEKYSDDVIGDASKLAASIESMLEISKKRSPVMAISLLQGRMHHLLVRVRWKSSTSACASACASKALKIKCPCMIRLKFSL